MEEVPQRKMEDTVIKKEERDAAQSDMAMVR